MALMANSFILPPAYLNKTELAESDAKEVRNVAFEALRKAGEPSADPNMTLKPEELDGGHVFAMTESLKKTTREVGMELILKHYGRIGGPERLVGKPAWRHGNTHAERYVALRKRQWRAHGCEHESE